MAKLGYFITGMLVFALFTTLIVLQHSQLTDLAANAMKSVREDHPMVNNILSKPDKNLRVNNGNSVVISTEKEVHEEPITIRSMPKEIEKEVLVPTPEKKVGGPLGSEEVLAQLSASGSIELTSVPDDTVTTVVSCSTSKGNLTIDIRRDWGPNGVDRYLNLVRSGFFEDLPFFRVCPRYITQFGVKYQKPDGIKPTCSRLNDDPSQWGVRDMDTGYLFYAGSGERSRGCQMVLALCDMPGCKQTTLGKTFWEVPIGTVRKHDHSVLKDIAQTGFPYPKLEMGGQHADAGGPSQGNIIRDPDYLALSYPNMAFWRGCRVLEDGLQLKRPLIIDYPGTSYNIPSKPNVPRMTMAKQPGAAPVPLDGDGHITAVLPKVFVEFTVVIKAGCDSSADPGPSDEDRQYVLVIEVVPDWSPLGASRFVELVSKGYFTNMVFFRVIKKFMAQFGISSTNPEESRILLRDPLPDEPLIGSNTAAAMRNRTALFTRQYPRHSNSRGTISYAMSGKNSRSNQYFINLVDNKYLDKEGFTPIARVVYGALDTHPKDKSPIVSDTPGDVNIIDRIYSGYGEGGKGDGTDGKGPGQGWLQKDNTDKRSQIDAFFPKLSYIKHARIL